MTLLYLTVFLPICGFLILSISCGKLSERNSNIIGIGSIFLILLFTFWIIIDFYNLKNSKFYIQSICNWISIYNFKVKIAFFLDNLSLTMLFIIISVSFLISLYSSWYMHNQNGYSRFFAYINLFIASMLILILADNLMLMYLGWGLVGLCSYLLIGFYHYKNKNSNAAIKAFIITHISDIFLLIALCIFYTEFNTLNFQELINMVHGKLANDYNNKTVTWAILMLIIGSIGKSAQVPLHTWLSCAMVGPTPVSALIHAATMVTVGIYLIVRLHELFIVVPEMLQLIAVIGSITIIMTSVIALKEKDIKQVLAYSTMSQIGYMFLALGVQAWQSAIFHLMIHAFFKALLFLSSGSMIILCNKEQNIFKMNNLPKKLSLIYFCFLAGSLSLSAFPILTASFYSKGDILWCTLINNHIFFTLIGLLGSLLTSIYIFRIFFVLFSKKKYIKNTKNSINHNLPLIVLLLLSTVISIYIKLPLFQTLSNIKINNNKIFLEFIASLISILGIFIAFILWHKKKKIFTKLIDNKIIKYLSYFSFNNFSFNFFYEKIFIEPYLFITKIVSCDPCSVIIVSFTKQIHLFSNNLTNNINKKTSWYIMSINIGAVLIIFLLTFFKNLFN